jgi:hypothetical protein
MTDRQDHKAGDGQRTHRSGYVLLNQDNRSVKTVGVLQFSGNLTDRQAAEAVRDRITWKHALGLELEDQGFDASVLSEFRSRLVAGDLVSLALDALLERLAGLGLVRAGGRQRTDSTHVLGAIRDLNRPELAGETLRAALEALAAAAPGWLAGVIDASWQQACGARIDSMPLPESQAKRKELMVRYGKDGCYLLERPASRPRRGGCGSCPPSRRCAGSGSSSPAGRSPVAGTRCGGGRSFPRGTASRQPEPS